MLVFVLRMGEAHSLLRFLTLIRFGANHRLSAFFTQTYGLSWHVRVFLLLLQLTPLQEHCSIPQRQVGSCSVFNLDHYILRTRIGSPRPWWTLTAAAWASEWSEGHANAREDGEISSCIPLRNLDEDFPANTTCRGQRDYRCNPTARVFFFSFTILQHGFS